MALTPQDIAALPIWRDWSCPRKKAERMLTQFNEFFGTWWEQMQAVDTSGVQPLAHPVAVIQDSGPAPA